MEFTSLGKKIGTNIANNPGIYTSGKRFWEKKYWGRTHCDKDKKRKRRRKEQK